MTNWLGRLAVLSLALCALAAPPVARADAPSIALGTDGETEAQFSYADAIRERVFIPVAGVDQDGDGKNDEVAVDIIRPRESDAGLKVPAIIDPSPYYTTLGRGNEGERIADLDGDGINDRWPLFYDNYFVPRGYAVLLADMDGTGNSTGCPMQGGPGDIASMKAVIDWLQGRVAGHDKDGKAMVAGWDNGKAAMIGKSYDGTLANGVAATGVDGLTTIVPISAISDWYDYSRMGGIRFNTNYPANLSDQITNPDRRALCAASRDAMSAQDGDENGDINDFWQARNYDKDVANVHAAVFESHGINDDNVRPNHVSQWWAGLAAHGVPRKLWLSQEGHVDPFEYRRAEWVDTLHRWFDHWLQGIDNGIMREPRVTIETAADEFHDYADWPLPGTEDVDVYLRGTAAGAAGEFGLRSGGATDSLSFTDSPSERESAMIADPTGSQADRLVFLSPPLRRDVHVSGTPVVDLRASLDKEQTNLGALLVDYGTGTHVSGGSDGVRDTNEEDCWGKSSATDDACYRKVVKVTRTVDSWRVSKGILDSSNRDSLFTPTPAIPGASYDFRFPILPTDYVFPAGHRIGVILVGDYRDYRSVVGTPGTTVSVDTRASRVVLPIVGGRDAAEGSGGFDTVAPQLQLPDDITVDASGPDGATVAYTATATDDQDPHPALECAPASGSVFAIGTTTVSCTATDAAGNASHGSFSVHVRGASEQAAALRERLAELGPGRSLEKKAEHMQGDPCGERRPFENEVRAQSGKKLTPAEAAELTADAERIAIVAGCS